MSKLFAALYLLELSVLHNYFDRPQQNFLQSS